MECLACQKKHIGVIKAKDAEIAGFPYCEDHFADVNFAVIAVQHGHLPDALDKIIERKQLKNIQDAQPENSTQI
jgi:hypothetical protein